jgi:hypothetical protein
MSTILVACASRHGSTAGVAERIATVLRERRTVDLRRADTVGAVAGYDARVALQRRDFGDRGKRVIGSLMRREPKGIREIREAIRPRAIVCSPE